MNDDHELLRHKAQREERERREQAAASSPTVVVPVSAGPVVDTKALPEFIGRLWGQLAVHGSITPEFWNEQVAHWSDPTNLLRHKLAADHLRDRRTNR